MATQGPIQFELTLKGSQELVSRTYRLDAKLRNILFLIQQNSATVESILQHSIFPREEVLDRVRGLMKEKFIALRGAAASSGAPPERASAASAPTPATLDLDAGKEAVGPETVLRTVADAFPALEPGISVSEARFVLCDFCLDQYGAKAQKSIDTINGTTSITGLQRLLDEICEDLNARKQREGLNDLALRVREINESKV